MKRKLSRHFAAGSPGRRTTVGQSAGAAALRQLINTIPDATDKCPLPVGQPTFAKCSRAIANFAAAANAAEYSQPLPFPSVLLPPPL